MQDENQSSSGIDNLADWLFEAGGIDHKLIALLDGEAIYVTPAEERTQSRAHQLNGQTTPLKAQVKQPITPDTLSPTLVCVPSQSQQPINTRKRTKRQIWTEQEHRRFLRFVEIYGRNQHTDIARAMGNMTMQQISSHSQKFFKDLARFMQPIEINPLQFDLMVSGVIEVVVKSWRAQMKPASFQDKRQRQLCAELTNVRNQCSSNNIFLEFIYGTALVLNKIKRNFVLPKTQ